MEDAPAHPRVLVCDDDPVVRSIVGDLALEAGYEVTGEAWSFDSAVAVLRRQPVDVMLLDLSLKAGNGESILRWVTSNRPDLSVLVFSAYATHPADLLRRGASAVVQKPDFQALEEALAESCPAAGSDQRGTHRPITALPAPAQSSPSGFEPWRTFRPAVAALVAGDSIVVFDVVEPSHAGMTWDPGCRLDRRLLLARLVAKHARRYDRTVLTEEGVSATLLLGGSDGAAAALHRRVDRAWRALEHDGVVEAASSVVTDDEDAVAVLARLVESALDGRTQPVHGPL